MIVVYSKNETNFVHNGLGVLDAKACEADEALNGDYSLILEHPADDRGRWKYLKKWNVIKADGQLFRIYKVEKTLQGIQAYARHIFYDLLYDFNEDTRAENTSCALALSTCIKNPKFMTMSDITATSTAYFIRENPVKSIFEKIIPRWGGELVRDNFTVKLLNQRGQDRGVLVSYGKNITGITETIDTDSVITRLYTAGKDGLTLPEKYIDSPLINNPEYPPFPIIREVQFSTAETEEDLRTAAQEYISKVDKPILNYEINLVELSKMEEYKHYQILERVYLGDWVTVKHSRLDIDVKLQVVRIKKDILTDRIIEIQLGSTKKDIANTLLSLSNSLSEIINIQAIDKTNLERAIEDATKLLTSSLGGYVLKRENELLIMDTQDPMTAQKVWRWNLNGLGYSSTGIEGPYGLAMTMNGKIVADFVTTGTLDTSLVTIKNANHKVYFDSTGLYCTDAADKLRLRIGQYAANKYGLQIKNKSGTDVILDEDGLIQTDTLQEADNVDATHPLKLKFYVDDGVISVKSCKLAFSLEKFRAYETGASNNDQEILATTAYNENTGDMNYNSMSNFNSTGSSDVSLPSYSISNDGGHSHDGYDTTGKHSHNISKGYGSTSHSHSLSISHTHRMSHLHNITVPAHTHGIIYGIYEGSLATGVKIKVDGTERLNNGGSGYSTDQSNLDISEWIQTAGWHTVELTSTQLGRINASIYIKSFVGV